MSAKKFITDSVLGDFIGMWSHKQFLHITYPNQRFQETQRVFIIKPVVCINSLGAEGILIGAQLDTSW